MVYPVLRVDYSAIDDILKRWSEIRRIPMQTEYKEVEVRSFDFFGTDGLRYQLWVDPPDEAGKVSIHVWDHKKRRFDVTAGVSELFEKLDETLNSIGAILV